jgi:uncharacterized secreted protein with C-terminal beta-propeller domain
MESGMENMTTVNLTLELDHKNGGFKDEASMLHWIHVCLNANSNLVVAKVDIAKSPTLVVEVSGGLIQNMSASAPVRVIVLDADVNGVEEERIQQIDGEDVIVSDHDPVWIVPAVVESTVAQLDHIDHIDHREDTPSSSIPSSNESQS